jgi:hypothetical protein
MISRDEILMGRDKQAPLTGPMEVNLEKLLKAVNKFRAVWGKPMKVTSGYRPAAISILYISFRIIRGHNIQQPIPIQLRRDGRRKVQ